MAPICPRCKSKNVMLLVHGHPNPKVWDWVHKGNADLRGCVICGNEKNSKCKDCKKEFNHNWTDEDYESLSIGEFRWDYWREDSGSSDYSEGY